MLLGMVVLVVGAGVIGASGAFSSVQAERTINIGTSGDGSALLGFTALDTTIAQTEEQTGTGDVAVLDIDNQDINENAETYFYDAIQVENNGDDNIDQLYVEFPDNPSDWDTSTVDFLVYDSDDSTWNSIVGSGQAVSLGAEGGTVTIGIKIDTTEDLTADDLPGSGSTITFVAEDSDDLGDTDV
jgi:hypothetical protein